MKRSASRESTVTRSEEKRMVRTRRPWLVAKPVRSTNPTAPRLGGDLTAQGVSGACASSTLVPPNTTWLL